MSMTAQPTETVGDTAAPTVALAPSLAADAAAPDGPADSSGLRSLWLTLPAGFAASLLCHFLLVLWGVGLFDGARPLAAAPPQSITVDLVPGEEARPHTAAKPAEPEQPGFNTGSTPLRPSLPSQPASPSPSNSATLPDTGLPAADPEPATKPLAERLAETLQLPIVLPGSETDTRPAESQAELEQAIIADFKAHLNKCWRQPAITDSARVKVLIRVGLNRDGTFFREPMLIQAVASREGPVLWRSALQALQHCQPYNFLPADKYDQWKVLDLAFSPQGVL